MSDAIHLRMSDALLDQIQGCTSREERGRLLLRLIDVKIEKFQDWSRKNLGDGLAKFEIAAIRTFLYRELTGELDGEGDVMHLPRVRLEQHPASIP